MTDETLKMSNTDEWKSDSSNFISEIRRMMYGFGDSAEPLIESATIINDIVQRQMREIIWEACRVAERRNSTIVQDEDFLFLLRRNKVKLQRLLRYLQMKEFKSAMGKVLDSESLKMDLNESEDEKLKKRYQKFFNNLSDHNDETTFDQVKHHRDLRAEMLSRKLDTVNYMEYAKARRATFANRHSLKFSNWISSEGDMKIAKQSYTILCYLAYETVASIMDLAFLVRQDQSRLQGDALDRVRLAYCNPSTYKPYQHGKSIVVKPLTPAEISEAIRRFSSPQLNKNGPFHRWSPHRQNPKFFAI